MENLRPGNRAPTEDVGGLFPLDHLNVPRSLGDLSDEGVTLTREVLLQINFPSSLHVGARDSPSVAAPRRKFPVSRLQLLPSPWQTPHLSSVLEENRTPSHPMG